MESPPKSLTWCLQAEAGWEGVEFKQPAWRDHSDSTQEVIVMRSAPVLMLLADQGGHREGREEIN